MTDRSLVAVFLACFALVLIANMPLAVVLRWALPEIRGISFGAAEGTVWNGRIEGIRWRATDLGNARIGLKPVTLLTGKAGAALALEGGAVRGTAFVSLTPLGLLVRDVALTGDIALLPVVLPVAGTVSLDIRRMAMARGGCRAAEGSVRTDVLMNAPAGLAWRGPGLSGDLRCDDGTLVIPLRGALGSEVVSAMMTLGRDGTFDIRIDARTADARVMGFLAAAGFVEAEGAMTLTQRGRWLTPHKQGGLS